MKDLDSLPKLYIRGTIVPREESMAFGEAFSAADVVDFLDDHKQDPEIVVEISSDGGSVSEGKEIYTRLKQSGKKITTITYRAMSIATLLMLAGQRRLIVEGGDFLLHNAATDKDSLPSGRLTSEDLDKISSEIKVATEDVINIYCRALGEDKRMSIMAAMSQDTNLGARTAIKLGFATGYYKTKEPIPTAEYKSGITLTDHYTHLIQMNMTKENENLKALDNKFTEALKKLVKMFTNPKMQVTLTLAGGKQIYVEPVSADAPNELKGAKVFEVDEAGLPTANALADGEHILDDGRVLIVSGGVITEVGQAVDAKKLQEENTQLKEQLKAFTDKEAAALSAQTEKDSQIASLTAEVKAKEENNTAIKTELANLQKIHMEFRKAIPGEQKKEDEIENPDFSKMTTAQRVRAISKQRQQMEKESSLK